MNRFLKLVLTLCALVVVWYLFQQATVGQSGYFTWGEKVTIQLSDYSAGPIRVNTLGKIQRNWKCEFIGTSRNAARCDAGIKSIVIETPIGGTQFRVQLQHTNGYMIAQFLDPTMPSNISTSFDTGGFFKFDESVECVRAGTGWNCDLGKAGILSFTPPGKLLRSWALKIEPVGSKLLPFPMKEDQKRFQAQLGERQIVCLVDEKLDVACPIAGGVFRIDFSTGFFSFPF